MWKAEIKHQTDVPIWRGHPVAPPFHAYITKEGREEFLGAFRLRKQAQEFADETADIMNKARR